jgi:regulator of CtrA degradation
MSATESHPLLIRKLVDSLYVESMVLTDEARAYFDEFSRGDRSQLDPVQRVSFSCESLKVTTRLMHVIAWLIAQRTSNDGGERDQFMLPMRAPFRLGTPVESDQAVIERLPAPARHIVEASIDLYARVERLDKDLQMPMAGISPARQLFSRLEQAF